MEIKSIKKLSNGDIEITNDKGSITVSTTNPVYEGLRLQFNSLGINTVNWVGNQSKYSPLRETEETLLYDVEEGQMKIPFPNVDYTSYQKEKELVFIGSEGQYWTQNSTEPPVYFNEEWNK
tara:strand:+ start:1162 stop:1524 length:363 start_codon:yes stop_codon:yes gene_type:complete